MAEYCRTCVYFSLHTAVTGDMTDEEKELSDGQCRRFPPVLITGLSNDHMEAITGCDSYEACFFSQPWVRKSDWCGEYKKKS